MIEFRDALTDLLEEFGTDDGGKLQLNLFVHLKSFHPVCLFIIVLRIFKTDYKIYSEISI